MSCQASRLLGTASGYYAGDAKLGDGSRMLTPLLKRWYLHDIFLIARLCLAMRSSEASPRLESQAEPGTQVTIENEPHWR